MLLYSVDSDTELEFRNECSATVLDLLIVYFVLTDCVITFIEFDHASLDS